MKKFALCALLLILGAHLIATAVANAATPRYIMGHNCRVSPSDQQAGATALLTNTACQTARYLGALTGAVSRKGIPYAGAYWYQYPYRNGLVYWTMTKHPLVVRVIY